MNDRELLEAAARAAGLPECGWMGPAFMYVKDNQFTNWNPLTDDGDALRLAVKLHLEIDHNHPLDNDAWVMALPNGKLAGETEEISDEQERYAATRRAIVRAAAAMAG